MNTIDQTLKKVVNQIFTNWTALQLVLENSGACSNSKKAAVDFIDYIINYILHEESVDDYNIECELDDYLDTHFDTICEDNSTKEIAELLYKFYNLIIHCSVEEFEMEFNKLPTSQRATWQDSSVSTSLSTPSINCGNTTENSNTENAMDTEDSDWIQVKVRNRKKH